jgi:hypothetical protein
LVKGNIKDSLAITRLKKILRRIGGIPLVVYKGVDLSFRYYPQLEMRRYSDIDLCVRQQDYFFVKAKIASIPGVFIVVHEMNFLGRQQGHAGFVDFFSGLNIEVHISKNPSNIYEYLWGAEYEGFFKGAYKVNLTKNLYYYSIARSEYLAVVVRQFLKRISMFSGESSIRDIRFILRDFDYISSCMTEKDWCRLIREWLCKKTIFMRMHQYGSAKTWLFFFLLITRNTKIVLRIKKSLSAQLSVSEVKKLERSVSLLQAGEKIDLGRLLSISNIWLFCWRLVIMFIKPIILKTRGVIRLF